MQLKNTFQGRATYQMVYMYIASDALAVAFRSRWLLINIPMALAIYQNLTPTVTCFNNWKFILFDQKLCSEQVPNVNAFAHFHKRPYRQLNRNGTHLEMFKWNYNDIHINVHCARRADDT